MKYLQKVALGLALVLTMLLGVAYPHGEKDRNDHDQSRVKRGFAILPVKLNLKGKNPALVGLGSYIVNAQATCADCHSCPTFAPQGNQYAGEPKKFNTTNYLAGGVPFGPFHSANITPDSSGEAGRNDPAGVHPHHPHWTRPRGRPAVRDAMACLPGHDGPRSARDLRVPKRDSQCAYGNELLGSWPMIVD